VFVGECAFFFANDWLLRVGEAGADKAHHSSSHKVARVELDASGHAVAVSDFVTGLALPTDALFGPDGAMYVADAEAIQAFCEKHDLSVLAMIPYDGKVAEASQIPKAPLDLYPDTPGVTAVAELATKLESIW
jgi:hypothetical protein